MKPTAVNGSAGPEIVRDLRDETRAEAAEAVDLRAKRAAFAEQLPAPPKWFCTPTAKRIDSTLAYAQLAGDIAVVYGGSGLGKTAAARRYASNWPNAWLATMTPSTAALGPCLERVLEACGVQEPGARGARLEAALRTRVNGDRGLLIVDEAQHLNLRALEALRGLHDATGAGLALLGNELVYTRLTGGRRAAEFAQLFSRVGKRLRLTQVEDGDVDALLAAWGAKLSMDRGLRPVALAIARKHGGLRGLTKTLRLAALLAEGEAVEERHMRTAWKDLGGGA